MKSARTLGVAALVAASAFSIAGCSQVDSLKQVSGVPINTLQIATGYVMVNNNVPVLISPVCIALDEAATSFECKGKTTDEQPIVVTASGGTGVTATLSPGGTPTAVPAGTLDLPMEVKVGNKVIYQGQAQAIIDKNQEAAK